MRHRLVQILVAALMILVLLPSLALIALNAGYLHAPLLRLLAWQNHRALQAGALRLSLLRHNPLVEAQDVTIGNPPWSAPGTMGHIARLTLEFRPLLSFDHSLLTLRVEGAELDLKRAADGNANWQRSDPGEGSGGPLPFLKNLVLKDTHLQLDDERLHLRFDGKLAVSGSGEEKLHMDAKGRLNEHDVELALDGEPLEHATSARPYAFALEENSSGSHLHADGSLPRPFDLDRLEATFAAKGEDLRDLYFLVGASLPNTGAYRCDGKFWRQGTVTRFDALSCKSGASDVDGALSIETQANGRSLLKGEIKSRVLRMADLGLKAAGRDPNPNAPPKLFSQVHLISEAMRRVDSDVKIQVRRLAFTRIELDEVTAQLKIDRGHIEVPRFAARLWDGALSGHLSGDANKSPPVEAVEFRLQSGQLDQFKRPDGTVPWAGALDASVRVKGHGTSVHEFVSSAEGTASAYVPQGALREAFAELAGVDLRGVGLSFSKNQREVAVRCAGAKFDVRDGVMKADRLLIDSDDVLISGEGTVALGPEAYDLSLHGQPKSLRILKMQTPVKVDGTLLQPKFSIDKNLRTLKLVDTGKAKDVDCKELEAESR
ncbi:MAG TPA: AsmA family protein [Steroidobacteraceae bacterium]